MCASKILKCERKAILSAHLGQAAAHHSALQKLPPPAIFLNAPSYTSSHIRSRTSWADLYSPSHIIIRGKAPVFLFFSDMAPPKIDFSVAIDNACRGKVGTIKSGTQVALQRRPGDGGVPGVPPLPQGCPPGCASFPYAEHAVVIYMGLQEAPIR